MSEPSLEERISQLSELYSSTAGVYHRRWASLLLKAGRGLLDRVDLSEARANLDVGAGVGALLDEVAARAPGALVVGTDRAAGMVAMAPREFGLVVSDATSLPFASDSFDVITMLFMLFHLPHPVDGLAEAHRVLRRGGVVATATWGEDESWPVMEVWNDELDRFGADEGGPLLSQHEYVDTPEKMDMHLRDARFTDVEAWIGTLEHEWDVESFVDCVTGMTTAKRRLDTLDRSVRPRFIAEATERVGGLPSSAFQQSSDVVFATGRSSMSAG
jgi:ubiquinone/menaquinone biosynthesis C-methylase UbiE